LLLRTRETVVTVTPARNATSLIVGMNGLRSTLHGHSIDRRKVRDECHLPLQ
jgi:hypothetical protein